MYVSFQRHLARQGVRCAPEAGVISPESHLDHIEERLRNIAVLDSAFGRVAHRSVDSSVVVGRGHDKVRVLYDAVVVGDVMMD